MAAAKPKDPATPSVPLRAWERIAATVVGLAALAFGTYATLTTTNGLGTISLIVLGGVFLVVGVLGLVPRWVQVGQIQADLVHNLKAKVEDDEAPPAQRQAAADLLARLDTAPRAMFRWSMRVPRLDDGASLHTCPEPGCTESRWVAPGEPSPRCPVHDAPMMPAQAA